MKTNNGIHMYAKRFVYDFHHAFGDEERNARFIMDMVNPWTHGHAVITWCDFDMYKGYIVYHEERNLNELITALAEMNEAEVLTWFMNYINSNRRNYTNEDEL